jgi:hypothetical protein
MADLPESSPILRFDAALLKKDLAKARDNVSAIALRGEHLWLGGDEGTSIDRMTRDAAGNFGSHVRFELKDLLALPASPKEEIDIEGLDVDGGCLWLIGSHSAKRKKADPEKTDADNVERLARVESEGNRFTLARVPLNGAAEPAASHAGLTAARLSGDAAGNLLTDALRTDAHLGRLVPGRPGAGSSGGVPSKDNGFDVEGLAVSGDRVFLGLRGPVLRGWAIVIELRVSAGGDGVLTLEPLGRSGERYLKHFLQLDGLGVRDLVIHGDDLLVLAGPSMDLDGPVYIYRWTDGLKQPADSITFRKDLARIVTVPFGVTKDHAEGISLVTETPVSILVCYDSPDAARIDGSGVKADIFEVQP